MIADLSRLNVIKTQSQIVEINDKLKATKNFSINSYEDQDYQDVINISKFNSLLYKMNTKEPVTRQVSKNIVRPRQMFKKHCKNKEPKLESDKIFDEKKKSSRMRDQLRIKVVQFVQTAI